MPKKKGKIVRVKFNEDWIRMIGDSYKPWSMQLDEYLFMLKRKGELEHYEEVTVSDSPWSRRSIVFFYSSSEVG